MYPKTGRLLLKTKTLTHQTPTVDARNFTENKGMEIILYDKRKETKRWMPSSRRGSSSNTSGSAWQCYNYYYSSVEPLMTC